MPQKNPNNLKTGLVLASIALVFFLGLVVKRMWFT
ncbi:MAG TPA: cytochrome oxidase small assembly protein [Burkholderiaceae bacterium]|nr:cytochrome oxidase small assembly protein [Burkholderiaceae bacterium]